MRTRRSRCKLCSPCRAGSAGRVHVYLSSSCVPCAADGLVINPDIGSPAFQVKSARALAADRLLEAESQSPVRIPAIRAQV